MIEASLLFSVDPSLGKVDKESLPQQVQMELLIAKIKKTGSIGTSANNHADISLWHGVNFSESGEVIEVNWPWGDLEGSIALEWIPSTVRKFQASGDIFTGQGLTGSINLTSLPPFMTHLNLTENDFSGEICLTQLPSTLYALSLSYNRLTGTLDLTNLPMGMKKLYLDSNCFFGETDFSKLPTEMLDLCLSGNRNLSGKLRWDAAAHTYTTNTQIVKIEDE
mmetsp:Transcript_18166/g.28457  ORF Transcript_18166/g.28457 Transcript_18166/m.28457 type:complete len:222 (-) Transcript_18166:8-673(-)